MFEHNIRGMHGKLPVALSSVICVCLAVFMVACGSAGSGGDDTITGVTPAKISVPAEREAEVVVDPSASFPRPYLRQSLDILAEGVRAVPGDLPQSGPFAGRSGLHFVLRYVSGDSYKPDAIGLDEHIPSVPVIDNIKAGKDGQFATNDALDVSAQRNAADTAYGKSKTAAGRLANELETLNLGVTHCSNIQGAISAAAESFTHQKGVRHVLIVFSDFAETCHADISGSLADVDVLAVLVCPTSVTCDARKRTWGKRFSGAHSYQFVRLEDAADMVRSYLTGGAS